MNPHAEHTTSPAEIWRSIWRHRSLIFQMTRREIIGRYKGSIFGLAWSFINPLFMLLVYTIVFSYISKARWGLGEEENNTNFALILFIGLLIHALFAEILTSAPNLVIKNSNYVKKVVFPLEVLSVINLGVALFHTMIGLFVLLIPILVITESLKSTILLLPLTILPMIPLLLGISWIISAFGTYFRDSSQIINITTTAMLFLAPVLYPPTILPPNYQFWINFNPITVPIEASRQVLLFGQTPNWFYLGVYSLTSVLIALLGFRFFHKTRNGFADVI